MFKKIFLLGQLYLFLFVLFLSASAQTYTPYEGKTGWGPLENFLKDKLPSLLLNFLSAGAAIAFVIGGFMFLFSGGDPGKASTGKKIIIYALIATLVALSAEILVAWL